MGDRTDWDDEQLAERVRGYYQHPAPSEPGARERLARTLAELPAPRRRAPLVTWLLGDRMVHLHAAVVLVVAAVMLVAGFSIGRLTAPRWPAASASNGLGASPKAQDPNRLVEFVLVAPGASCVSVVGDFNAWDAAATPMARQGAETWVVRVRLSPGRHVYAFVRDGERWISDPWAPLAPANEFGFRNSVVIVGESAES
ncbi:MAG TPA: isoamylase early set domain-containing protein [Candidatus Eisenbacteria bacterium]|jgi:hypothetical protein